MDDLILSRIISFCKKDDIYNIMLVSKNCYKLCWKHSIFLPKIFIKQPKLMLFFCRTLKYTVYVEHIDRLVDAASTIAFNIGTMCPPQEPSEWCSESGRRKLLALADAIAAG